MSYSDTTRTLADYRRQIRELRGRMRTLQAAVEPQRVDDYEFATPDGKVRLSALFDDDDTLIVIHNMGAGCPYCTLWADGFNGSYPHLRDRAAFVVSSPDPPERQRQFAQSRGWKFPMVSVAGTRFAQDMGYWQGGHPMPGVSVFKRNGSGIVRVSDTPFSPGDDFCFVWHFFDLIPEGPAGWQPRYRYDRAPTAEEAAALACRDCG
jgi:predicted dithiol-disulfide oxidoreductase (DUF899 family)